MINTNLTNNFLTISNNIHKDVHHFRVAKNDDGMDRIVKNGWLRRFLFKPWYSRQAHKERLQNVVVQNINIASKLKAEYYVQSHKQLPTDLYLAAHKYNQTLAAASMHKPNSSSALYNTVGLNYVVNEYVPDLKPTKIHSTQEVPAPEDLILDKPEPFIEKRMFKKHQILRYPGDSIDHSQEAVRIFVSTQKERIISFAGTLIENIGKLFGLNTTYFQKYHYRSQSETDEQIYAQKNSPVSLSHEPTSFWLGHATLFLGVPLKSKSGSIATFNVITDPVEGDLNPILYPRQTKFALPLEQVPAPHVYLLSHNHLDHFSKESIQKIFAQQPIMIVPQGDGSRYRKLAKELGFDGQNIIELNWWEKRQIDFEKNGEHYQMTITATPARHWSGQGPCGGHESTFLGYVIQGHEHGDIYFAGDTARLNDDHINKLKEHFNIRWNFQPGGPDDVREDMESTHQASVDALWMHFKLQVSKVYHHGMDKEIFVREVQNLKTIFMHTMTYKLGNLHLSDTRNSVERVLQALTDYQKTLEKINTIEIYVDLWMSKKAGRIHNSSAARESLKMKKRNKLIEKHLGLKSYEKQVFDELCHFASRFEFAKGEKCTPAEVSQLLKETVLIPKIGSRISLDAKKSQMVSKLYF